MLGGSIISLDSILAQRFLPELQDFFEAVLQLEPNGRLSERCLSDKL